MEHDERFLQATDHADALRREGEFNAPASKCFTVIPVLQFLWGKPWNNLAVQALPAVRPSRVRVSTGEIKCDVKQWRVTVYLEKDNRTIKHIEQEVQCGADGLQHGSDFGASLGLTDWRPR